MKKNKLFIIILCLMSLMVLFSSRRVNAYNYAITSNFTVSCKNNVFTIKRDKKGTGESVFYRTISKSALEGEHFTRTYGRLDFGVEDDAKTVTVQEMGVTDVPIVSRYQTVDRIYGFEVYDVENTVLARCERTISYGDAYKFNTQAPASYKNTYTVYNYSRNQIYNQPDYVYNNNGIDWTDITNEYDNSPLTYYNGLKIYYPTLKTIDNKRIYSVITDSGYNQKVYAISLDYLFDCYGLNQDYVAATGVKIYARGFYDMAEIDDGYQYVQVLLDDETSYDSGAKNGDPGKMVSSIYMAGFTHYDAKKDPEYATYCIPARDGDERPFAGAACYQMVTQKFSSSYPATTTTTESDYWSIPASTKKIVFRFDASGKDDDDYKVSNLGVELHFVDEVGPKCLGVVTPYGTYHKGEVMTIALKFNEIIHSTSGIPELHTNIGDFTYSGGIGTNVVYFTGTITTERATKLVINSVERFYLRDLLSQNADDKTVLNKTPAVAIDYYQNPGIINNIYQISTRGELYAFQNIVNGTGGKTKNANANGVVTRDFKLENCVWTPINNYGGTFDGAGHEITFAVRDSVKDALETASGMFGKTLNTALIKDLKISSISSNNNLTGLCNENNGTIDKIIINISKSKNNFGEFTGAIACTNKGTITRCIVNDGDFSCTGGDFYSGGICGKNEGTISYSYSLGLPNTYSVYKDNVASICLINNGSIINCHTINSNVGIATERSHFVKTDNTGLVTASVFTKDEAKGGKLCYLLNDGVTDGTQDWYQTLSSNMYPVMDNSYETVYCDLNAYANHPGHELKYVNQVPYYGYEYGHTAYYECDLCHRLYADANGEVELDPQSVILMGPLFMAHSISISDCIGVRFKLAINENVDMDTAYMTYSLSNGRKARQDAKDAVSAGDNFYWFTCKINPLEFGDNIFATFYYGDNQKITDTYRASTYSTSNEDAMNVFNKLKDYCYYLSQTSWTDGLNHNVSFSPSSTYTESDLTQTVDAYTLSKRFVGAFFASDFIISLSLNTTIGINLSMKIKEGFDVTGCNYDYEIEEVNGDRILKVKIPSIKLSNSFTNHRVTVESGSNSVEVNVSILGYIRSALQTLNMSVEKKRALYAYYMLYKASKNYTM